ncbi:MAG: efflux RND transporter periplasmic adaptor subunit [Nitrosomonadales bacterium]|nr:efflux RND transporter periplasmic adaptor subunit [Nitrosomonadales bacterium]
MEVVSQKESSMRRWIALAAILLIALAAGMWIWRAQNTAANTREAGAVQVVSAPVMQADVPARLSANGTVTAVQTVEVRPQISAIIKTVHIREGQSVRKGDRLFTLDARTEDANLGMAEAQITRDRADLTNAERNLERQRELFRQEYVSRAELDTAQNQVDMLRSQVAIDQASVEASRVARSFGEITAPIAGRTGAIAVYPGSLVQPSGAALGTALVSITQTDPINVSFTLPERELADVQQAFARGAVPVAAKLDLPGQPDLEGRLVFIDNAVDTASGTIRLKAEFPNPGNRLWPGIFVTVTLAPRTLAGALTVPVQAVQTGPEHKFVYAIGDDRKVSSLPVNVRLIQDGIAVIEGAAPGARVVVEGAHNLRPGDVVAESGNGAGKQ